MGKNYKNNHSLIRGKQVRSMVTLLATCLLSSTASAGQVTIFSDGFEGGNLANKGWTNTGGGTIEAVSASANSGSLGARAKRGASLHKVINTSGFSELEISYDRKVEKLAGSEDLKVQWSYDGSNWTTLETVQASATGSWGNESYTVATDAGEAFYLQFNVTSNKNTERANIDNVSIVGTENVVITPVVNPDVVTNNWAYSESNSPSLVAAAQVSGHYAVADRSSNSIEVRDVREDVLYNISAADIQAVLPNVDLSGDNGLCSMAFTPSGRLLFISVCDDNSTNQDAILAYNDNTKTLSVFDKISISAGASSARNYGMVHYKGELFVGTDNGMYRYDASRNAVADGVADNPIGAALVPSDSAVITGLAVDMVDKKLYLSTPSKLYRSAIASSLSLETVASLNDIKALTMARTYGSTATSGLYLLSHESILGHLYYVPVSDLHAGGAVTPVHYTDFSNDLFDIAATADGQMLLAGENDNVELMSDNTDARMDFDTWLADELQQYVVAIKSLVGTDGTAGTTSLVPPGFLIRKIVADDQTANSEPIADNIGWALFLLLAADQAAPDADIEPLIELLIQRHAGLHPDGLGGVKTVDGHFMRNYLSDGSVNPTNPLPQMYTSMKFIPAVDKAVELYPNNANFKIYQEYLRQSMKRASDTIRAEQRITWQVDDHGPADPNSTAATTNNRMTNETWIYGDMGAAQDPLATEDYGKYVYERAHMDYDHWLTGEPVIKASHSAFIIMGGTMILRHHFEDQDWNEQNRNYYAITMAETDDLGSPYFAAFSAGNNPWKGSYYNDGPSDHPGDMIHFPAVQGLGQLGWTAPMVGAYMAYRDGLRQEMLNSSPEANFNMLTRISLQDPNYVMPSVGIADFWYGAIGLAETIQPGLLDSFRGEYYVPELKQTTSSNGNVELHYSKITPRRIVGIDGSGNETAFGFQLTPFEFSTGESFSSYKAVDPEGELIELNDIFSDTPRFLNPNFEDGLVNWTQNGDYKFFQLKVAGKRIVGMSAEIRPVPGVVDAESSLSQTLDLSQDLTNTRYTFRGNGSLVFSGAPGKGYLRVTWDNDDNASNGVISSQSSNLLNDSNRRVEFEIQSNKPAGANYAHVAFVVEAVDDIYHRYVFDNFSVERLGASTSIINGDFENGMTDWTESNSQISLTTDPAKVIDGTNSLLFAVGPGLTGWKSMTKTLDVSNDPLGTRYIFRLDTNVISMVDSNFEVMIQTYDTSGNLIITRYDVGDILPTTEGETTFSFRKRPQEGHYVLTFRMKRNSSSSPGTDEIVIDNFRVDKEQLF